MRPTAKDLAAELLDRLDRGLLPVALRAGSLDIRRARETFRAEGLPHRDPEAGLDPSSEELARAAARVVERAARRAALTGRLAGLGGLAGIPAQAAADLLHALRLAQRLACLHGFDPADREGRVLVRRALAAAWEVDLPPLAIDELRTRDLPRALIRRADAHATAVGARMARAALRASTSGSARAVPVVASLVAGREAARRLQEAGGRMAEVFRAAHAASERELAAAIPVTPLSPGAPDPRER